MSTSYFNARSLAGWAADVFAAAGMDADKASCVADLLVTGEMLGQKTHGIGYPGNGQPVWVDVSTSITTVGMARQKSAADTPFDHPWLLNGEGKPTTDPHVLDVGASGTLLPVGGQEYGHKGFGLSLLVEALTQGLVGFGRQDSEKRWGANIFLQVMDPAAFAGREEFLRQMNYLTDRCHANAPIDPARPVRDVVRQEATILAVHACHLAPDDVTNRPPPPGVRAGVQGGFRVPKILRVNPMRSLADRALAVAADLGIGLQVEMAQDDNSTLTALSRHPKTEVVVTRGGLVDCSQQVDTVSVVPISTSITQLLTLLQDLSARGLRKVGVVSRESLVDCDVGDFTIAGMEISIRSCTDEDSVKTTVAGLAGRGIEAIIGCRISCAAAQPHEMMAICLESDDFSIRVALLEAARRLGFGMEDEALTSLLRGSSGEQMTMVNGRHILARRTPLDLDGRKYGEVITFLEATKIQDSEVKVRVSARQKGFYAKNRFEDIVGRSEVMRALIEKARRETGYDANILIQGETGTGKEILAQSIHNHSRYRTGPFVSVNTASIPPSLLESELFGLSMAPSPARAREANRACSRWLTTAPSSSMKSAS